jgi:hypothetical protein
VIKILKQTAASTSITLLFTLEIIYEPYADGYELITYKNNAHVPDVKTPQKASKKNLRIMIKTEEF